MEGETCPAVQPIELPVSSPKPPASPTNILEEKVNLSPKTERVSPEPNCAICLGKSENKSFTDSCLHQFCFNCLLEWSKVKAECPLCKQSFKSIIHNVRSNEDYDQYHLRPVDTVPLWNMPAGEVRRFRYRSTLTVERRRERAVQNWVQPFILGSDAIPAHRSSIPYHRRRNISCEFRFSIYQQNLWVSPLSDITGRYRECSPEFYRLNPAQIHRLVPWLNRELSALLPSSTGHRVAVMDLIVHLLPQYLIHSLDFRSHISPYLGGYTSHFLHEFYEFARSPYDMIGFDQAAQYVHISNYPVEIPSSSDSDSDVIVLSPEPSTSRSNSLPSTVSIVIRSDPMNSPEDLSADRSRTFSPPASTSGANDIMLMLSQEFRNGGFYGETHSDLDSSSSTTTVDVTGEANQGETEGVASDPNECVIVGYVKPRHERTPEIITLDSEPEVIEEGEIAIGNGSVAESISDDLCEYIYSTTSRDSSSDSEYVPNRKMKHTRRKNRSVSRHARSSTSKLPLKKRRRRLSSSSSCSSVCEHSNKRVVLNRKRIQSLSSDSSCNEDEQYSHDAERKQPRAIWRIMKHQRLNTCREPPADHDYSVGCSSNGYQPPYNPSEIVPLTDGSRPKLRSIVITRSTTSDNRRERSLSPVASSSRSSSHPYEMNGSRSSSHRRKHKSNRRDERRKKKKKLKRRSSSPSPVPSHSSKSKRKKKKSRKGYCSQDSSCS